MEIEKWKLINSLKVLGYQFRKVMYHGLHVLFSQIIFSNVKKIDNIALMTVSFLTGERKRMNITNKGILPAIGA